MNALWDVIIVGAGPAGSTAAMELASKGHAVLLVDRFHFPRDKVCGDGLIPDALDCLRRLGLYEKVRSVSHVAEELAVFSPSRIEFRIPAELLTLKRSVLDEILRQEALTRGAQFVPANVERIEASEDGVVVETSRGRFRALFGVVATGANVALLRALGMVERAKPSAAAVRCYVRSTFHIRELVVSFDKSVIPGYAWIFPLGGGEYNVGCGLPYSRRRARSDSLHTLFAEFLAAFPLARRLMEASDAASSTRGHALRYGLKGVRPLEKDRILVVGESVGATFPLTGEGIGKAMETAERAADLLHSALSERDPTLLREYPDWLEKRLRPKYHAYEVAERWQSHAWLSDLVALRARRSPYFKKALAGILSETSDPRAVFSIGGLARSLWA